MNRQIAILFFIGTVVALSYTNIRPIYAAKIRVWNKKVVLNNSKAITYSTAKINRETHSVDVFFQNLDKVSKVSYELSYLANGISQGAMGSYAPTDVTGSQNVYFGTCSKGVCTPHTNITGATLIVKSTLKSGLTNTKLYRIKI